RRTREAREGSAKGQTAAWVHSGSYGPFRNARVLKAAFMESTVGAVVGLGSISPPIHRISQTSPSSVISPDAGPRKPLWSNTVVLLVTGIDRTWTNSPPTLAAISRAAIDPDEGEFRPRATYTGESGSQTASSFRPNCCVVDPFFRVTASPKSSQLARISM